MTVYFLANEKRDRVKIGFTHGTAISRLAGNLTMCPEHIEILAEHHDMDRANESHLHKYCKSGRVPGKREWYFSSHPRVTEILNRFVPGWCEKAVEIVASQEPPVKIDSLVVPQPPVVESPDLRMPSSGYASVHQAAAFIQVSLATIYRLVKTQEIPSEVINGEIKIPVEEWFTKLGLSI